MDGTVDGIEVHSAGDLGDAGTVLDVYVDGSLGQLLDERSLPVRSNTLRIQHVECAVQGGVGQGTRAVGNDRGDLPERLERLPCLGDRSRPVHDGKHQGIAVAVLRDEREGWCNLERGESAKLLRRVPNKLVEHLKQRRCVFQVVEDRAREDLVDVVQLEFQRRHHPEVASTATQRPEQVWVLLRTGRDEVSVGCNHISGDQVVNTQTAATGQIANATAEGEAGDTGGRDDAACGGKAERVGGVVEVSPGGPGANPRGLVLWVDPNGAHERHVDDQATVVGTEPGSAVAPISDRQVQVILPGEVDARDDVAHLLGVQHRQWPPVEHAVVNGAGLIVPFVVLRDDPPPRVFSQCGCYVGGAKSSHFLPPSIVRASLCPMFSLYGGARALSSTSS